MPLDSVLTLGDFVFQGFEVPASLPFGGTQALVVHRLPGGKKIIQAMGADPRPIGWSGRFRGANAVGRARYLDGLRIAGAPLKLTWLDFSYSVVIASFNAEFERFYEVPYSITVEVQEDQTNRPAKAPDLGYTVLINNDLTEANAQADAIGDAPLSGLMGTLGTAIKGVSDFAKATTAQITSVLGPLADVRARVGVLIASTSNTVNNVTTLGGLLPGNSVSKNAAQFLNQATAITRLPQLYNLDHVLGRIGGNVNQLRPAISGAQVTMAGGNLYDLAADKYSDATKWNVIADANNLSDPNIHGVQTITVPQA